MNTFKGTNILKNVSWPIENWEDEDGNMAAVDTYSGDGADVENIALCGDTQPGTLYWYALKVLAKTKSEACFEYGGKTFLIRFYDDGRIVLVGSGKDCNPEAYDEEDNFLCEITAGDVMYLFRYYC